MAVKGWSGFGGGPGEADIRGAPYSHNPERPIAEIGFVCILHYVFGGAPDYRQTKGNHSGGVLHVYAGNGTALSDILASPCTCI